MPIDVRVQKTVIVTTTAPHSFREGWQHFWGAMDGSLYGIFGFWAAIVTFDLLGELAVLVVKAIAGK
jgi:hypothetical protein